MSQLTSTHQGIGYYPPKRTIIAYNRSGATVNAGDVLALDLTQDNSEVTTTDLGKEDSVFANAQTPTIGDRRFGVIVAAMETIADNAKGRFLVEGVMDVFVIKASGNIAIGDELAANINGNLDGASAAGYRYYGIALEAQTTPTSRVLSKVYFKGDDGGFGVNHGT